MPAQRLPLELAQEQLLALHAAPVAELVVAEAHEAQGVVAVEPLIAGLEVDRRVAGDGGVVGVLAVDVEVDAAEVVDDVDEADEVDVDEVVRPAAR